jgi:hypothetical protein
MERPTCRTCVFWDYVEYPGTDDDVWECHAEPPGLVTAALRLERAKMGQADDPQSAAWPLTAGRDWCGRHSDFPAYLKARAESQSGPASPTED